MNIVQLIVFCIVLFVVLEYVKDTRKRINSLSRENSRLDSLVNEHKRQLANRDNGLIRKFTVGKTPIKNGNHTILVNADQYQFTVKDSAQSTAHSVKLNNGEILFFKLDDLRQWESGKLLVKRGNKIVWDDQMYKGDKQLSFFD